MLSVSKNGCDLEGLVNEFENTDAVTADLVRHIITKACPRFLLLQKAGKTTNADRSIQVGAWCDVALALIKIELPAWSIRRLVHEDGEWFCSLTNEPNLPLTLDDTADFSHPVLPVAILGAFIEALQRENCSSDRPASRRAALAHASAATG